MENDSLSCLVPSEGMGKCTESTPHPIDLDALDKVADQLYSRLFIADSPHDATDEFSTAIWDTFSEWSCAYDIADCGLTTVAALRTA